MSATVARSSLAMAGGSVASRILGVVRQSLITLAIGQGLVGNAFTTANTLPNIVYMVIAGGVLNSVFVPQLVKAAAHPDGGREYTDRLLTLTISGFLVVTVLVTVGAPLLVKAYAASLTGSAFELTVYFAMITLPQTFFYYLYALLGQLLIARGRFTAFGWAPAAANVVAIAGLVLFLRNFQGHATPAEWTPAMIWLFAGSATAGIVTQALILVVALWRDGFRWRPRFGLRGVGLRATSQLAGWAMASLLVSQLIFLVSSQVIWHATGSTEASPTDGGVFVPGISVQSNAMLVFMVPHALVTLSILTAIYPRISRWSRDRDLAALRSDYVRGLTVPAALTIPASAALIVLAVPIMGLLFTSRNPAEIPASALVLSALAPALLPFGVDTLNQRMFYALEDGRTALTEQVVLTATAVTVALVALTVRPEWTVPVIALGLVASNTAATAYGMRALRRRIGDYGAKAVVRTWVRMALASVGAGYLAWGPAVLLGRSTASWGRLGYAVTILIAGSFFTMAYLLLARLLQVRELAVIAAPLVNRLDRRPPGRHRDDD